MRPEALEFFRLTTEAAKLIDKICITVESKEDILMHIRNAQYVAIAQHCLGPLFAEVPEAVRPK